MKPDIIIEYDGPQRKLYSYIIVYIDDILLVSPDPDLYMKDIGNIFHLDPYNIKEPDIYLGTTVSK